MQQTPPDKAKSEAARAEGNAAFKKGKWVDSIGHYTHAIVYNPADAVAYCNRAQAFLKLDKYADAERDCSNALERQQDSIKALYRRALARRGLDDLVGAESDLWHLLKLDPKNETAHEELDQVRELIKEADRVQAAKPKRPLSPPRPAATKPAAASAVDIDSKPIGQVPTVTAPASAAKPATASNGFAALRQKRDARPAHVYNAAPCPNPPSGPQAPTTPAASATLATIPTAKPLTTVPPSSQTAPAPSTTPSSPLKTLKPPTDPTSTAPGTGLLLLRSLTPLSPADGWYILAQYPPSNISRILGSILEPDDLATLLRILQYGQATDCETVKIIMTDLQATPRIRMNAAMLDQPDRAIADTLWATHSSSKWP